MIDMINSENTPQGYKTNKLDQILLNGNNICTVRETKAVVNELSNDTMYVK